MIRLVIPVVAAVVIVVDVAVAAAALVHPTPHYLVDFLLGNR